MKKLFILALLVLSGCNGGNTSTPGATAAGGVKVSCMDMSTTGVCTPTVLTMPGYETITIMTSFQSGTISISSNGGNFSLPSLDMVVSNATGSVFTGYWVTEDPAQTWCIGLIASLASGNTYSFTVGSTYQNNLLNIPLSQSVRIFTLDPTEFPAGPSWQCWGQTGSGSVGATLNAWVSAHTVTAPVAVGTDYFEYVP